MGHRCRLQRDAKVPLVPTGTATGVLQRPRPQGHRSAPHQGQSGFLDENLLKDYYLGKQGTGVRAYHHTTPVNMVYALREALRILAEVDA
jgi:aspartate aminotransferase-like enzyme